ncbi:hypothetical protein LMG26846_03528 [Achromobacter insuavis]|uniref:D-glucuronyl C5-epimerase family protein n=1 Tax=Achromobacter insuavis TaxID=1287735 RepID=UPI001466B9A5|nr:D-glucuronyl C5-epimerase family protein [Achromobacter insuavis]CAB3881604.1 hypothetical protein LMG26846_03528 [Achromobacter insuavis]
MKKTRIKFAIYATIALSIVPTLSFAAPLDGHQIKSELRCGSLEKSVMPAFTEDFEKINRASYKIDFMADNFPGQVVNGTTYAHPLYGTYALSDYINAYKHATTNASKATYKKAVEDVAKAVICHMEVLSNGGLASYYDYPYIAPGQKKFYSALTQAQYLPFIHDAAVISQSDAIKAAGELIVRSLELRQDEGGVVFEDPKGNLIPEEYPGDSTHPPQFVLNGWMDVLIWLDTYYGKTKSPTAKKLLTQFGAALEHSIEKYNAPDANTSLYKLSEIGQINFLESAGGELEIKRASVAIPTVGAYPITLTKTFDDRAYKNVFFGPGSTSVDGSTRLTNNANAWLWLSLYPPEGNTIELELKAVKSSKFMVRLLVGKPQMRGGGKTDYDWLPLTDQISLEAGKTISLKVPISRQIIMAATQPLTSFKPITVGNSTAYVNVYHYAHISQLCRLSTVLNDERLKEKSISWEQYTEGWNDMPMYKNAGVDLRRSDVILGIKGKIFYSCLPEQAN